MNRIHIAMFVATLLAAMILFRWQLIPVATQDNAYTYQLDRWTGSVVLLSGNNIYPVEKKQPSP